MATERNLIFANGQMYYLYNRGLNRQPVFTKDKEFQRMFDLVSYYRLNYPELRYSKFKVLAKAEREHLVEALVTEQNMRVDLISYAFTTNQVHFLVRQTIDNGVTSYMSNITNGYTKYFNGKHERRGPLFEGTFLAKRIETDEQLKLLSRHLHVQPVITYIKTHERLVEYPWTSYGEYVSPMSTGICTGKTHVLDQFTSVHQYEDFVLDSDGYEKNKAEISHLLYT